MGGRITSTRAAEQGNLPTLEADIQALILVALTKREGALFWRNNTGSFRSMDGKRVVKAGKPGSPDILGCYKGRFVGIEVKACRGSQREAQEQFEKFTNRAGGIYRVCRSPDAALAVLDDIDAGRA